MNSSTTGGSTGGNPTTQNGRPSVTLLQALNVTANSATLLYNGTDPDFNDLLTYTVCYTNLTVNGSATCLPTTNREFVQVTGLNANTQYSWTVSVADAAGTGTTTNGPLTFTTLASQPSNLPPSVHLTGATSTSDTKIIVSWQAANDGDTSGLQFDICYALDQNSVLFNCPDSITGGTYFEINNLHPGTQYYVTVRVREPGTNYNVPADNGPFVTMTTGTPVNPSNRMPVVTLNSAQNITSTAANFSWVGSNMDSGESFNYRFCLTSDLNALLQNCNSATTNTTASRSGLTPNTTYYYTVLVSDGTYNDVAATNGPRSFQTLTGTTNNPPSATQLAPTNGSTTSNTSSTLTWTGSDPENATVTYALYIIEQATGVAAPTQAQLLATANRLQANSTQTSFVYSLNTTNSNRTVYWVVAASDGTFSVPTNVFSYNFVPNAQNLAPSVTLQNPTNNMSLAFQANYTLQWAGTDPENNALVYDVYALEVPASSNQTYTNSDLITAGNRRTPSSIQAQSFNISVAAGNRLWWTVVVSDGTNTNIAAANGPFRFDVQQQNNQQNVTATLSVMDQNNNVQTIFNQNQTVRARLTLMNNNNSAQTLNFATQQQQLISIVNVATGVTVRDNIPVGGYGNTASSLTIPANSPTSFTFDWDQRDNNGNLVPAGQYRIDARVTTATPIVAQSVTVTINGAQQGNSAPQFTSFTPASGSNFNTLNNVTLNWAASDVDNNTLNYQLFLLGQPVGQAAPSLATVMAAANRVNIAATATTYSFAPTNNTQYFWVVTVTDNLSPVVIGGTMPFNFTVNTSIAANAAPVVALTTPGANPNAPAINYTTAGNKTFSWTSSDADGNALTHRLYVLSVPLTDLTQYTSAQIIAQGQMTNLGAATSSMVNTIDQRVYWWTVDVSDNIAPAAQAFNGPFTFTVNSSVVTPVNLLFDLVTSNSANGVQQNTFNANEQTFVRLNIQNTGNTAQVITFPDQNWVTVTATNVSNQLAFTGTIVGNGTTLTIQPGAAQSVNLGPVQWNGNNLAGVRVNGSYNINATLNALNFNPAIAPENITLFGTATPTNNAPVFTAFSPTNGSNIVNTQNPINLTWAATDADGNTLNYQLYLMSQPLNQTAPTLAQLMVPGNLQTLTGGATATSFQLSLTPDRQYFWAVTVTDNIIPTPIVGGTMPFTFTTAQNLPANNGPIVTLTAPGAPAQGAAVNLTTAGVQAFTWTGTDADVSDIPNLQYRLYVYQVPLTNNTQYTSAQVVANAQFTSAATSVSTLNFTTTDQFKYWWTVSVTDLKVATPVQAFNGPFTFTVNSLGQVQNLVPDLLINASNLTSVGATSTFDQTQVVHIHASIRNTGNTAQNVTFSNTNWLLVQVRDASNNVVFQQQVVGGSNTLSVAANSTFDFPEVTWSGINMTTGTRTAGNYTVTATLQANNFPTTFPPRSITLTTTSIGSTSGGGGGGGGGGGSGGGSGGGGTNVDIASPLYLPTTDTGARTWYGPVRFDNSNGEVKIDLTHIDAASNFCAKWSKDTIVTNGSASGSRFTGSYAPIQRYEASHVDSVIRSRLPQPIAQLYTYFLQYGNLNEVYSKPVTICGNLPEDIRTKATNKDNIAILGYDPQQAQWVKLGDLSNIANGRDFSFTINKSMIIGFFEVGGSVIPGGNNGTTTPSEDDTFCRNFGSPFTDTKGHWADYYVCRLYKKGIVSGYLEGVLKGLFGPDRSITRAELTKILIEMNGVSTDGIDATNARGVFRDVAGDEWFAKYVVAAQKAGIVEGYSDGYFRPFQNINRAEAVKIILLSSSLTTQDAVDAEQLLEKADSDMFAAFPDVPENEWFTGFVVVAKKLGLVAGKNGQFRAGDELTRAEMAKIAFFVLELK